MKTRTRLSQFNLAIQTDLTDAENQGFGRGKTVVVETEDLIKKGYKLTIEQECRYEFAKILLREIGKRRKKQDLASKSQNVLEPSGE